MACHGSTFFFFFFHTCVTSTELSSWLVPPCFVFLGKYIRSLLYPDDQVGVETK